MTAVFVKFAVPGLLCGMLVAPLSAQAAPRHFHHTVANRFEDQQHRISQGIRSGELTPREAARLERREGRLHREAYRDRLAHRGHLTGYERRHIDRQLNRTSGAIYRHKHNPSVGY